MRLLAILFFFSLPLQADLRFVEAELGLGYRQDNLDWSFAGEDNEPNILSELEWNHIKSWELSAVLALAFNAIYIRGSADYGRIYSGQNWDSDYEGDDRTGKFVYSKAKADKGEVFDLSAGAGYVFEWGSFTCAPLVGWSTDEQHFRDRKGVNIIDKEHPAYEGMSYRLHSQYYAKWQGPWIGMDAAWHPLCHWLIKGGVECHWVKYDGRGHWNTISYFARDFEQTAKGHGILGSLSVAYKATQHFLVGGSIAGRKFKGGKGRDRKFYNRDKDWNIFVTPVKHDLRFNGAHWDSLSLKVYISCTF